MSKANDKTNRMEVQDGDDKVFVQYTRCNKFAIDIAGPSHVKVTLELIYQEYQVIYWIYQIRKTYTRLIKNV